VDCAAHGGPSAKPGSTGAMPESVNNIPRCAGDKTGNTGAKPESAKNGSRFTSKKSMGTLFQSRAGSEQYHV
jgi:hypothetical protein